MIRVFHGRPVALIGASAGRFGTILSQNAWLPVLRTLRADFWSEGRLRVSRAGDVVDENGEIVDEKVRGQLRVFVEEFVEFAGARFADRVEEELQEHRPGESGDAVVQRVIARGAGSYSGSFWRLVSTPRCVARKNQRSVRSAICSCPDA
jgi:hypothetical protein